MVLVNIPKEELSTYRREVSDLSSDIDLNNSPFTTELLQRDLAKDTGFYKEIGFCKYPLWEFKEEFLKQIGEEKYKQYSDEYDKYMKDMYKNTMNG